MDIDTIYTQLTRMSLLLLLPTAAVKRRVHASIYIILLLLLYIYTYINLFIYLFISKRCANPSGPPGDRWRVGLRGTV